MLSTKQKINRFLRTSNQHKKFIDIVSFIISLLTPEQLKTLEIQYEGEVINFKAQLFLTLENRYENRDFDIEELKTRVTKVLSKYKFLFETNLKPQQIRTILLRELIEVISFGFLCHNMRNTKVYKEYTKHFSDAIKSQYPRLPSRKRGKEFIYFWQECLDYCHEFTFPNKDIKNLWYSEFFKKTKWYFEQLHFCEPEYIDKYREGIYKEIRFAMNIWSNYNFFYSHVRNSHVHYFLPISRVKINTNTHLQKIIEEVLSYFSEEELTNLEKIDSQGEKWSFKEQLLDRYYSKYPSFVPLEEIKPKIKERVEQYKPLLRIKNKKETIKELFLDELEQGIFVSEDTNFWNQEMLENLNISGVFISKNNRVFDQEVSENLNFSKPNTMNIYWDVKRMLNLIKSENKKHFYLEIEGKKYDLKTLFTARWKYTIWDREKRQEFKKIKVFPIICLETLKNKDMSKFDMQVFLEKMDFFFLTPKRFYSDFKHYDLCFLFLISMMPTLIGFLVK